MTEGLVEYFKSHTNRLFWLDACGALVSISIIGFIWTKNAELIGMPKDELYLLATIPIFFIIYDLLAIRTADIFKANWLVGIAVLNSMYCLLSAGLLIHHSNHISTLGWVYFTVEIAIVLYIAYLELKLSNSLKANQRAEQL